MSVIPAQRSAADSVTIIGDTLRIQLSITHPETVALARRQFAEYGQEILVHTVTTALTAGMLATAVHRGAGDTAAAMARVLDDFDEAMQARATTTLAQLDSLLSKIDATETASRQGVTDALAGLPGRIEQGLTAALAGGAGDVREAVRQAATTVQSEALAQLERVVRSHTAEVRNAISTENPNSPIAALRRDLSRSVESARRELVEGLAAVRALIQVDQAQAEAATRNKSSSAVGRDFEDSVLDIVTSFCQATGDCAEHVGDQPAPGTTRKTGDMLIRVMTAGASQPVIAIEAKRRARALTARQLRVELADAKRVRRAHSAVAVVPTADQVPGPGRFVRIDKDAWVVAADDSELLGLMLAVIRELTVVAAAQGKAGSSVDLARAQTSVNAALELLGRLDEVTRHTGVAERALAGIRGTADSLRSAMTEHLQDATRALRPTADSA